MRRVPFLLFFILTLATTSVAIASPADPYMVQPQVQSDLENLLSRMIPNEQFLVQISADIALKQERQIVEGEVFTTSGEKEKEPVRMMPGFLPEVREKPEREPQRSRQVYRMVEKPVLRMLRVSVTFDDALEAPVVSRAKQLVQNYLRTAYPNQAIVSFTSLEMLKPKKELKPEETPEEPKKKKKDPLEDEEEKKAEKIEEPNPWEEYGPYALGAFVLFMLWMWMSQSRARQVAEAQARAERRANQKSQSAPPRCGAWMDVEVSSIPCSSCVVLEAPLPTTIPSSEMTSLTVI